MWYKIVQVLINTTLREIIYLSAVCLLILTNGFDHIYGQIVPTLIQYLMFYDETKKQLH